MIKLPVSNRTASSNYHASATPAINAVRLVLPTFSQLLGFMQMNARSKTEQREPLHTHTHTGTASLPSGSFYRLAKFLRKMPCQGTPKARLEATTAGPAKFYN